MRNRFWAPPPSPPKRCGRIFIFFAFFVQERGIEIQNFKVIYELYDTVVAALESDLDQEEELTEQGVAEVKAVFNGRDGKVAGSEILEGTFLGSCNLVQISTSLE